MQNVTIRLAGALLVVALTPACGKPKPCADIPTTKEATALGVVLDGGHLCKADSGVINVDYDKPLDQVDSDYMSKLSAAGWKGEKVSEGKNGSSLFFDNGKNKLLVVTLKNKDRNVSTAIIKHCLMIQPDGSEFILDSCLTMTQSLADNLKKTKS
ncbi:MAG: hypothetical protein AB7K71_10160 [Polyangiaceae bacterium]